MVPSSNLPQQHSNSLKPLKAHALQEVGCEEPAGAARPGGADEKAALPRRRATSSQQGPEPMGRLQIQGVLEELGAGYARLNPVAVPSSSGFAEIVRASWLHWLVTGLINSSESQREKTRHQPQPVRTGAGQVAAQLPGGEAQHLRGLDQRGRIPAPD